MNSIYKLILKYKKNLHEYYKKSLDYHIIFLPNTFETGDVEIIDNMKQKKITCIPIGSYHNNVFKWYDGVNEELFKIINKKIIYENKIIAKLFKYNTNTFEPKHKEIIPTLLFLIFKKVNIVKFVDRKSKTEYFFQIKLNLTYDKDFHKLFITDLEKLEKINSVIKVDTNNLKYTGKIKNIFSTNKKNIKKITKKYTKKTNNINNIFISNKKITKKNTRKTNNIDNIFIKTKSKKI